MRPHPDAKAELQQLRALAEQYMERMPVCFLCCAWPGTTALVFLGDAASDGRAQACVFATCVFCWLAEDFQARVSAALHRDQHEREACPWK